MLLQICPPIIFDIWKTIRFLSSLKESLFDSVLWTFCNMIKHLSCLSFSSNRSWSQHLEEKFWLGGWQRLVIIRFFKNYNLWILLAFLGICGTAGDAHFDVPSNSLSFFIHGTLKSHIFQVFCFPLSFLERF